MNSPSVVNPAGAITTLLAKMDQDDPDAISELMPLIYVRLRQIAAAKIGRERGGHTMQASDLLQEVCLRIVKPETGPWRSRRHFFAVASQSMRQVLVDYARAHHAIKRRRPDGTNLKTPALHRPERASTILDLDDALKRLAKLSTRQSRVVELRFFCGLTVRDCAGILGISATTVKEEWALAKAWLHRELRKDH
jgi:RNA polymerase sigma-70 factor, ECF subfamily